jgi:hypothetical protein
MCVVAFNLQLVKFDGAFLYKFFKRIIVFLHQLLSNFFWQSLANIFFWLIKIWEKQDEHFFWVA